MEIKCEYCGSMIQESAEKCPYCGATNNAVKRTTDGTPKTIEQLQKWYEDRQLPPYEVTRFFIGINYTNPKAFGIYKDGNEFVVYKNKADGQRAIRYRGTDEAYAVNELYLKLKDEILNQKAHNQDRRSGVVNSSSTNSTDGNKRSPAKWSGVLKNGLFVLGIIAIIIVMFNYYKVDYYRYNDTIYVNSRYEWFEYDGYDYDVVDESDIPADMLDNKSTYGYDYSDSKWDSSITEFKDSNYYAEHYDSSDQDSDFDWDSGDSWDSNDTNWDSDW